MKPKKAVRAKARKPKAEQWRAELARIVKFLNKGDGGSKKLWDVLSALRGPDEEGMGVKECSTSVLRAAIGMKGEPILPAHIEQDSREYCDARQNIRHAHFRNHMEWAFGAFGLKWDEVN